MMGADSFEDHRARVLGRGDDHPGMAMEYYMEIVISVTIPLNPYTQSGVSVHPGGVAA
jgi:hypothetical protein